MSAAPGVGSGRAGDSAITDAVADAIARASSRGVSCFRNPACAHEHLDLRRFRALRFCSPGDLTIGADCGMTAVELNAILAQHGLWVPLDVPHPETRTLGSILSTHASGPWRQRYGTVRDFTIGMEMVTAQARIVHGGGRVVKNVAGYDWMKLAIGARGGLGILTGVNFRVFPLPRGSRTLRFAPLRWAQVEALRSGLLHSPLRPLAIELWVEPGSAPEVAVRVGGSPAVLDRCQAELTALAQRVQSDVHRVPEEEEVQFWERIRDFPQPGDRKFSIPPAEAVACLSALGSKAAISGRLGLGVYHVRGRELQPGDRLPSMHPTPMTAELMRRVRHELDPEGLLHGEDCRPGGPDAG